jgi:hypothetical protein
VDDGAFNEDGLSYSIFTGKPRESITFGLRETMEGGLLELSDGGFTKWIIDGLVTPIAGRGTRLSPVMEPTLARSATSAVGILGSRYNLTFAFDWVRNLSTAAASVQTNRALRTADSGTDVRINPFVHTGDTAWVTNAGYQASGLLPLLYTLAITEPGTFYLGAIRETDRSVTPEVHYFNRSAAIFPFFDDAGHFDAVVFEDGQEYGLAAFLQRNSNTFVHLCRVRASSVFSLQ